MLVWFAYVVNSYRLAIAVGTDWGAGGEMKPVASLAAGE